MWIKHFPVFIVLLIYLPGAIWGEYLFRDKFSNEVLTLLFIFSFTYYLLLPTFGKFVNNILVGYVSNFRDRLNWTMLAWVSVGLYSITILIASITTEHTPLGAALLGGGELDIARARADFLATRQGSEAILRYSALILGKSVMPFIVLSLFIRDSSWRYLGLCSLLFALSVALEKSATVFAFLPILIFFSHRKKWWSLFAHILFLLFSIGFLTFLASGALVGSEKSVFKAPVSTSQKAVSKDSWPTFSAGGSTSDWKRMNQVVLVIRESNFPLLKVINQTPRLSYMINRAIWIPYITAYDWLRFQDQVLKGKLTYGQQITGLGWLFGKPKLQLEQMVYDFQLGSPEAGFGASNTIFLVDAKISFGWVGVVAYSVLITILSAIIFSSTNQVAKISSVTCFYTAALSPLSATFLSGGLFFIIFMALFQLPIKQEFVDK